MSDRIAVVGLGYVGLPLAVAFDDAGRDVVGFDIDSDHVEALRSGRDPTDELGDATIDASTIEYTTDPAAMAGAAYFIIGVPTPVDEQDVPNLDYVEAAGRTVGEQLREGGTVVLESTVFPGATRELLVPTLEEASGLTASEDFGIGYSPERMVPGDSVHGLENVVKIVSGDSEETLADVAALYEEVVDAGVHRAPDIEVAEAAKNIENVQRDLNIALMNELSVACESLGLDTQDVLEAAGTKWNFHEYSPGLVGGHCIPVDPFFFIHQSKRNGFSPELVEKAREVNEYMPKHAAKLLLKGLNEQGKVLQDSSVAVLGLTYKANVEDVRTSVVNASIHHLEEYGVDVVGVDPRVEDEIIHDEFGIEAATTRSFEGYDALLIGAAHDEFADLDFDRLRRQMNSDPAVVDTTGQFEEEATAANFAYQRL
jgi:UDP-N-acetyl-D-galactosamine dehydrogenase